MRAAPLALLALLVGCASSRVWADEGAAPGKPQWGGNPNPEELRQCATFFAKIHGKVQLCETALDVEVPRKENHCPDDCKDVFEGMPVACQYFFSNVVPDNVNVTMADDVMEGKKNFTICDLLECPTDAPQQCSFQVDLLSSLSLLQLEVAADNWTKQYAPPPESSFNGVKVAVIVAGVVAGNLVIVGTVFGVWWLRRRRRKQRRLAEGGSELTGGLSPHGSGGVALSSDSAPPSEDVKLEQGDLDFDSAERGRGKQGGAYDIAAATAALQRSRLARASAPSGSISAAEVLSVEGSGTVSGGSTADDAAGVAGAGMPAGPPARSLDSAQGVAALWAAAAARGAADRWPPPQQLQQAGSIELQGSDGSAMAAAAATLVGQLQPDEHEMMELGSKGALASGALASTSLPRNLQDDPLLNWVNSRLQQGSSGRQSPAGIDSGSLPSRGRSGEAALAPAAPQQQQQQQDPSAGDGLGPPPLATAASRKRSSGGLALDVSNRLASGLVDLTPWQLAWADLDMQRPLGEGSFGKVFLAKWRETLVAVKLLVTEDVAGGASGSLASGSGYSPTIDALQKEAGLMAALRHPQICQFIGIVLEPPALVSEYCSRGSLLDVIRNARASEQAAAGLTWVRRLSMALDAAKGMLCLHSHSPPVIHRDLKSPNLLVDSAWRVKVCDFNLSKLMDASASVSSTGGAMNPRWLAPEVLKGQPATARSDVFSFGCVLQELLTWELPWAGANLYHLVFTVSNGERLPIPAQEELPGPDRLSPAEHDAYVALIRRCWAQQPEDRPTFADVIVGLRAILSRTLAASTAAAAAAAAPTIV